MMWWQWASQMTAWLVAGGSIIWLAPCHHISQSFDLPTATTSSVRASASASTRDRASTRHRALPYHWLMQWCSNALCLVLVLALSLALALALALMMWWQWASQMTGWCGGSGQVKWLTDVVAGGKSNDWLMQWYGNALCLVLALSLVLALALALTDDVVAVGKSNDWLMWWQGASQMIDWCSDTVTLYV